MNSLPITCKDAATTFLLARRAERLARPLMDMVGGAWRLSIDLTLGDREYSNPWHIDINIHYASGAAKIYGKSNMPFHMIDISDSARLEHAIDQMRRLAVRQVRANSAGAVDAND